MATNIDVRKGLKLKTTEGKWFLQRSLAQPQWNDTIWLVLVWGHVGKALDTWSLTGYNAQNKKTPKSKFHCSSSLFVDSIITAWAEVKVFEAREVPLRSASSPRGIGGGIGTQDSSRLGTSSGRHVNEAVPTTVHAHSCSQVQPRVSGHHLYTLTSVTFVITLYTCLLWHLSFNLHPPPCPFYLSLTAICPNFFRAKIRMAWAIKTGEQTWPENQEI